MSFFFFFFNDTATTEIYTLSLHERSSDLVGIIYRPGVRPGMVFLPGRPAVLDSVRAIVARDLEDRKSTRLNSSHLVISYAVFCLKKKKQRNTKHTAVKRRRVDTRAVHRTI